MILLKRWTLLLIVPALIITSSCNSDSSGEDELVGNWVSRFSFNGRARSEAVNFTIGNKTYIGTGINDELKRLNDFWEFDATTSLWRQVRPLPGVARSGAVAFSVGGKGYVGTGFDDDLNRLKDFYEYTPPTGTTDSGTWVKIGDFAGLARQDATAFSLGNKGYVISGYSGSYEKDFWEFTPGGNGSWVEKTFPGNKRQSALVFIVNNKAYFGTGINNGIVVSDFWEFDQTAGWTRKRDIANTSDESYDDDYGTITRSNGSAFSIGARGFLTTGETGSNVNECWSYDPATDLWVEKTTIEFAGRTGALGLTVAGKGYIMTGRNGNSPNDDLWEFFPDAVQVDND